MGVIYSPESEIVKERERWEQRNYDPRNHPFPKMLYMARQRPDGKVSTGETDDTQFRNVPGGAEQFTKTCQRIVRSEDELRRAKDEGWRESQAQALEHHEYLRKLVADAAAHRAYEDRNMSEPARAEAAQVDAEEFGHVAEVQEKKRRGRPPNPLKAA